MNRAGNDRYERIVDDDAGVGFGIISSPSTKKKILLSPTVKKKVQSPTHLSAKKKIMTPVMKSPAQQGLRPRSLGFYPSNTDGRDTSDATATTEPPDPSESSNSSRDTSLPAPTMSSILQLPLTSPGTHNSHKRRASRPQPILVPDLARITDKEKQQSRSSSPPAMKMKTTSPSLKNKALQSLKPRSIDLDPLNASGLGKSGDLARVATAPLDPSDPSFSSSNPSLSANTAPSVSGLRAAGARSQHPSLRPEPILVPDPRRPVPRMETPRFPLRKEASLNSIPFESKRQPTPRRSVDLEASLEGTRNSFAAHRSMSFSSNEEVQSEDNPDEEPRTPRTNPSVESTIPGSSPLRPIIVSDPARSPTMSMTFDRLNLSPRLPGAPVRVPSRRRLKSSTSAPQARSKASLEEIQEKNRQRAWSKNVTKQPPTPPRSRNYHTSVMTEALAEISRPDLGHRVFASI